MGLSGNEAQKDSADPSDTKVDPISAAAAAAPSISGSRMHFSFTSCYPFPEWPFPLLLLLFLVFSLARPNKKELLQKESFLSETLLLLVFPSVFPRPAQQERITLKRKKRRLTITKAFGTPPGSW